MNVLTLAGMYRCDLPTTFLRAAWLMENSAADVSAAKINDVIRSYLQPLEKLVPTVAIADIGQVAAELLREQWTGWRIVELEGPRRVSPEGIAASLSGLLDRPVRVEAVPRTGLYTELHAGGARNLLPRAQMIDGFNEGWTESDEAGSRKCATPIETVLRELVACS